MADPPTREEQREQEDVEKDLNKMRKEYIMTTGGKRDTERERERDAEKDRIVNEGMKKEEKE